MNPSSLVSRAQRSSTRQIDRQGFTLVELAMVLLVMGILVAVAAPKYWTAITQYSCDLAAKEMEADLAYAAGVAQHTSQPVTVQFNTANHRYRILGVDDHDHPGQVFERNLSTGSAGGVTLLSADFAGTQEVTFDIHGRPDSAGVVVLEASSEQRTISVDVTGRSVSAVTATYNTGP
ncbi:GspH/FimT family pseudopilin [Adhaeretor mobilis]|uniref:Type II secretion system protein H n=1 Tax=Adhaeretor mobilis TaxID=1930276 RepID=A0A517MTX4_9BACT|nr:GspH/FimT family pseudopilin [Adhaeretor mobilis]QDS98340.1 hypothetical protein HG15A2_16130 [Adhaeretor mobilis]